MVDSAEHQPIRSPQNLKKKCKNEFIENTSPFNNCKQRADYIYRVIFVYFLGFSWGTVKLESREARNALLEHVLRKPFRPDNETGWVLNKFEKCTPLPNLGDIDISSSPKRSPVKKNAMKDALGKKHASKKYDQFTLNTKCFWRSTRSNITPNLDITPVTIQNFKNNNNLFSLCSL